MKIEFNLLGEYRTALDFMKDCGFTIGGLKYILLKEPKSKGDYETFLSENNEGVNENSLYEFLCCEESWTDEEVIDTILHNDKEKDYFIHFVDDCDCGYYLIFSKPKENILNKEGNI